MNSSISMYRFRNHRLILIYTSQNFLLRIGRNAEGSGIPRDALLMGRVSRLRSQMEQHQAAWAPHRARVAERISAAAATHTQHAADDPRQPHQVPFPLSPCPSLLSPFPGLIDSPSSFNHNHRIRFKKLGVLHVRRMRPCWDVRPPQREACTCC